MGLRTNNHFGTNVIEKQSLSEFDPDDFHSGSFIAVRSTVRNSTVEVEFTDYVADILVELAKISLRDDTQLLTMIEILDDMMCGALTAGQEVIDDLLSVRNTIKFVISGTMADKESIMRVVDKVINKRIAEIRLEVL